MTRKAWDSLQRAVGYMRPSESGKVFNFRFPLSGLACASVPMNCAAESTYNLVAGNHRRTRGR